MNSRVVAAGLCVALAAAQIRSWPIIPAQYEETSAPSRNDRKEFYVGAGINANNQLGQVCVRARGGVCCVL